LKILMAIPSPGIPEFRISVTKNRRGEAAGGAIGVKIEGSGGQSGSFM
jgi:hypothetical protein